MADFGFWELALILSVALLVVGPKKLPGLAFRMGQWSRKIRHLAQNFKDEITAGLDQEDLKKTIGTQQNELEELKSGIQKTTAAINRGLRNPDPVAESIEKQVEEGRFSSDESPDADMGEDSNDEVTGDGGRRQTTK